MGIRSALRVGAAAGTPDTTARRLAPAPWGGRSLASPWSPRTLETIVWNDLLDTANLPVSRAEAMTVPPVARARHLLVTYLAGLPLVALKAGEAVPEQPPFLYRTSGASTPWHRMAWTLDDILMTGWALWSVVRGADRTILDATRVPPEWWTITPDGWIEVNGTRVNGDDVVLFPGPAEGLLEYAARTIRAARNVETTWAGRVRNPIPAMEIHQTTDDELDQEEVDALVDAYAAKRLSPNGSVTYTPSYIELRAHGDVSADVLVEARNAIRLDVANFTGLPAEALDGSLSTASLTYTTQQGTRTELADDLRLWADPIVARLSQDDVVPRGQYVRFDTRGISEPLVTPFGPPAED